MSEVKNNGASNRDDGGTAFPFVAPQEIYPGMSLRDYFAGQALAGLCAFYRLNTPEDQGTISAMAYQLSDSMISERAKP